MATLPSASVTVSADAGALAGGTGYCVVMGAVGTNADVTPRVYSSAAALLSQHGYAPGVAYAADHIQSSKKPVIFIGLPAETAGALGQEDASGWTGNSVPSVAAGASGYLEEVDAILTVTTGGTRGTTGIKMTLSLDGGVTEKPINLGEATSYTIPYVGMVLSFTSGTMVTGDVYTFKTTAPLWGTSGIADARLALAAQQKLARSWFVAGDCPSATEASAVVTAANAYASSNDRFTYARVSCRDHLPLASMARATVRMSGTPTITFLEVNTTGDTITRGVGSFIDDGFAVGMVITVSGAVASTGHNNVTGAITGVSATVLTLDTADLVNEGPISNVHILGSHGLVFAASGDTITRSGGSFLDDGFAVGDSVTVDGSASNDGTRIITVLTDTVMTFASGLADETIGSREVSITKGETMAAWVAEMDSEFTGIDGEKRIDIALGRGRKECAITGWQFRRPASWHASVREYQHDVHIPCWRKSDGPLSGVSLEDADGNIVEYDERTDGGALAGRFTCLRTYGNGPNGAFIALSLTRDTEGTLLSRTHNMAVANLACTVVQAQTENVIGAVLQLKDDGRATEASLGIIESKINSALEIALLQNGSEGPRASKAVWRASRTDVLNVPGATLTGVCDLHLNGTVEHIETTVKVS